MRAFPVDVPACKADGRAGPCRVVERILISEKPRKERDGNEDDRNLEVRLWLFADSKRFSLRFAKKAFRRPLREDAGSALILPPVQSSREAKGSQCRSRASEPHARSHAMSATSVAICSVPWSSP